MTDQTHEVGADLLAIPEGLGAGGTVRIGVQATPSRLVAGALALSRWPAEMAGLRFRVRIADFAAARPSAFDHAPATSRLNAFFAAPHRGEAGRTRQEASVELWQRIFAPVGFEALYTSLPTRPDPVPPVPPLAELIPSSSRTADLQLFFDRYRGALSGPDGGEALANPPVPARLGALMSRWIKQPPRVLVQASGAPETVEQLYAQRYAARARLEQAVEALLASGSRLSLDDQPELEAVLGSLFAEHHQALFGRTAEEPDEPTPPEPPTNDSDMGHDPQEAAQRKLAGLLSVPTLSHYFGLGVQLEIDSGALGGRRQGLIAVEAVDADGNPLAPAEPAWTAFDFEPDSAYFAPAARDETLYRRGLLNLRAEHMEGGTAHRRFVLGTADVSNMVQDLLAASRRSGGDQPFPGLDERRRGFVLYDICAREKQAEENLREREELARLAAGDVVINFADDLVRGCRPDFALAPPSGDSLALPGRRWRSLTGRRIICTDPLIDPSFYEEEVIEQIAHRDHGFTLPLEKIGDDALDGQPVYGREDELFVWPGESLALAAPLGSRPARGQPVSKTWDVGLDLGYLRPEADETELHLCPLRENRGYACGCRLVFVNGSGPTIEEARARYQAEPQILIGDSSDRPYRFPGEPALPPDVHLLWNDPLVDTADPTVGATGGETSQTLVIRDGGGSSLRVLTPARADFHSAELQGQFDEDDEDLPPGALKGGHGVWLFGDKGIFPEARFGRNHGSIRWLDEESLALTHVALTGQQKQVVTIGTAAYEAIPSRQSRGTVAILGPWPAGAEAGPFYPDANAARVQAQLSRTTLDPHQVVGRDERAFWGEGDAPREARPLLVELAAGAGAPEFGQSRRRAIEDVTGTAVSLGLLRVKVGPAESGLLRLRSASAQPGAKWTDLRLVHAVKRPLLSPSFMAAPPPPARCTTAGLGLNAVSVSVGEEEAVGFARSAGVTSWREKVAELEATGIDMRCWPSEEGGSTTFFTGRVRIDRKSTGTLRCEARWQEFDEKTVALGADGKWVYNPSPQSAQLFRLDVERDGAEDELDLLRAAGTATPDEAELRDGQATGVEGRLRALSHSFRNGRARRLSVRMLAGSAFTAFYPPEATPPEGDEEGRYERGSEVGEVWAECTFRPPPPAIDRVLPLFTWADVEGRPEGVRRTTLLRVYLGEGWYASGEDERLGIVLLDEDEPQTVCDYEEGALKPFARFVTRCGADPARQSPALPIRLRPEHFVGAPAPVQGSLHLGEDKLTGAGAGVEPLQVKVLPYRPNLAGFDPEQGLYCDVEIDLGASYFPFVQLGLVRYQEHAVEHLTFSRPIEFQVQLLPKRDLWIEVRPGPRKRTFVMQGSGFEVPLLDEPQPAHRRNAVDLHIMIWDSLAKEWRAQPLARDLEPAVDAGTRRYTWRHQFDLPGNDQRYRLLVEEYERLPADRATGEYAGERALFEEVADRRVTFSWIQEMRVPQPRTLAAESDETGELLDPEHEATADVDAKFAQGNDIALAAEGDAMFAVMKDHHRIGAGDSYEDAEPLIAAITDEMVTEALASAIDVADAEEDWRDLISQLGYDFIVRWETGGPAYYDNHIKGKPIWPGYSSGVTIGCGYDLGYHSLAQFRTEWGGRIPEAQIARLAAAIGLRSVEPDRAGKIKKIKSLIAGMTDIIVPWNVAIAQFDSAKMPKLMTQLYNHLDNVKTLHPHCRGALLSLVFNRGPSFGKEGDRYREMRAIGAAMRAGPSRFGEIPNHLRNMRRIWGPDSSLARRREGEAELFERGLAETL
jgi:hypothetical protein